MRYFISSFNFENLFSFRHQSSLELNEVYTYIRNIFKDNTSFINESIKVAQFLYEISTHPNIKRGELYIAYLGGCIIGNKKTNAIGIFKSENKDVYINTNNIGNGYEVYCKKGVNVNKLDKGCIVFDMDEDDGYRLAVVDSNSNDSIYWKKTFLNIEELGNAYRNTKDVINKCKKFVNIELDMPKTQKIELLSNSLQYFQNNEVFNLNEFSEEVFLNKQYKDKFVSYINDESKKENNNDIKEFLISDKAIGSIKRSIKNSIRLDSNVEIRISSKINNINTLLENGYDNDKKMRYYKIYYKEEE